MTHKEDNQQIGTIDLRENYIENQTKKNCFFYMFHTNALKYLTSFVPN